LFFKNQNQKIAAFGSSYRVVHRLLHSVALTPPPLCGTVRALLIRPSLQIRRLTVGGLILSGGDISSQCF
ncbi:hypothetical protein NJC08_26950, partial [Pseudomonas fluorescens]|uniref:hypothetical protein n=1 Tax=Pseudomonas fluorescens TaxID=294 RepID=UPI00209B626B